MTVMLRGVAPRVPGALRHTFARTLASLELRADIFNLFNRVNLASVTSDLSSSLFGMSTAQSLPRSTQFGIHISF